jgi:hypothetical protein
MSLACGSVSPPTLTPFDTPSILRSYHITVQLSE